MSNQELPKTAYHPRTGNVDIDDFTYNSPKTVSELEQLIRVAFAIGGLKNGHSLSEKAIEYLREYEKQNVYDTLEVDRSNINNSNDIWLQQELHKIADKRQEALNEEKELIDRRMDWFKETALGFLNGDIENRIGKAQELLRDGVEFVTVRIVENDADGEFELLEEDLNGASIRKYGFKPPVKLTVCKSTSGSIYPFVPWCGTTVCVGPSKNNPVATLCKHELAALDMYSRDAFNPDGLTVEARFKRLTNPEAYKRFTDNISP